MKKLICFLLVVLATFSFAAESKISKKEMYLRARDVLRESLIDQDVEKSQEAFEYLKANVDKGAPLTHFEEYLALMEMGRFEDGIKLYSGFRRIFLDSGYVPTKEQRISETDALNQYLYRNLSPFTREKADSLSNRVDESNVSQEFKDLYKTLIYSELVVGVQTYYFNGRSFTYTVIADTTCADEFVNKANDFVANYPLSEHSRYLKNQAIPFVKNYMDKQRLFRKNPWAHKYYTGGLAVFAGKWLGFMSGELMDLVNDKMGTSFIIEGEIQYRRVSLGLFWSFGLINEPKGGNSYYHNESEDESMGITLGVTAFDTKYLKVTPFVGISEYIFMEADDWYAHPFILGFNIDSRVFATRPNRIGALSFALNVRFKYMAQIGSITDSYTTNVYDEDHVLIDVKKGNFDKSFASHTFALELGISLW